jgi:hypothetical protein
MALLRAPRLSLDGSALAFIDDAGQVAILDLETNRMSTAPFVALSAPLWEPDGASILLSGLEAGPNLEPRTYVPGTPVPLLDPASTRLDARAVTSLRVVRMARGASTLVSAAFGSGAARPAVDARGLLAYIRLSGGSTAFGRLWVTADLGHAGDELAATLGAHAGSAAFAPEPDAILVGRVAQPGGDPSSAGIWLVDLRSGRAEQLSGDGWLPAWLP